jgi:hypothetical protein
MMLNIFTREETRGPARLIAGRFAALPANLQHHANERRFVCWRYGSKKNGRGKFPKIPFNPIKLITDAKPRGTYLAAEMDNSATWGTFAEVCAALRDWPTWFGGWGIVLMPGEVGIDLDDVVSDGELHPFAKTIVDTFAGRAYIEYSVSETGVHIIALGRFDEARKTDVIEVYPGGTGRFFTVSGLELEGSARPAPAQDAIDLLGHRVARSGKRTPKGNTGCCLSQADTHLVEAIAEAHQRLPELKQSLHNNATPQLIDLVKYNRFPAGMGTTSSEARAVVVAQLLRAPTHSYSDAEIVVLALELWRKKGYEGQMAGNTARLQRDAIRLIDKYRPRGRTIKPKTPTDKRRTQAGGIDRFFSYLQERICGPTTVKTADLADDHGISRRSAITYLDRLAADGRIHIDRKRGRNGGMVIGFGPAENVQAFSTDEAPVSSVPTPESAPSDAPPHNTDQESQTRVLTAREQNAHILDAPPTLPEAVKEAFDVYHERPRNVRRKKGRAARAPLTRKKIADYITSNYPVLSFTDTALREAIEQERHDRKLADLPKMTPGTLKTEISLAEDRADASRRQGTNAWRWWALFASKARQELARRAVDATRPKAGYMPCEVIPNPREVAAALQAQMWGIIDDDAARRPMPARTARAMRLQTPQEAPPQEEPPGPVLIDTEPGISPIALSAIERLKRAKAQRAAPLFAGGAD